MLSQQLALNISLRDGYCFESFYAGEDGGEQSNFETVKILESFVHSSDAQQNLLWGKSQSGKTHLLQACCAKASQYKTGVTYLPLRDFKAYGVEIFSGLGQSSFIAIDDIDQVTGDKTWETSLFNLINITRENKQPLLLSCAENPRNLSCELPDLASRLIWGGVYQLHALTDTNKPKALKARARQRGFELTDRVVEYLYRRYPRDIESLMEILDILDKESLRQKMVVTVPFAKKVLEKL